MKEYVFNDVVFFSVFSLRLGMNFLNFCFLRLLCILLCVFGFFVWVFLTFSLLGSASKQLIIANNGPLIWAIRAYMDIRAYMGYSRLYGLFAPIWAIRAYMDIRAYMGYSRLYGLFALIWAISGYMGYFGLYELFPFLLYLGIWYI